SPTPARAALSRTGASTPEATKAAAAASSSAALLRRASLRRDPAAPAGTLPLPLPLPLPPSLLSLTEPLLLPCRRNAVPFAHDGRREAQHQGVGERGGQGDGVSPVSGARWGRRARVGPDLPFPCRRPGCRT